jgi:hypothetical protein
VFCENSDGIINRQRPYIHDVDVTIGIHITPKRPERPKGNTIFRGTTGIVWIVHKAALTDDNVAGNILN